MLLTETELTALLPTIPQADPRPYPREDSRLNRDQHDCLTHWSRFGSSGYPIEKLGRNWWIRGYGVRGLGSVPVPFKTKSAAQAQWQRFISILIDYEAGRLSNPALKVAHLEIIPA